MLKTEELHKLKKIRVRIRKRDKQANGSDCGLFSIAFATSLVYGQNLANVTYIISQMHPHLLHCLRGGVMNPFPTT